MWFGAPNQCANMLNMSFSTNQNQSYLFCIFVAVKCSTCTLINIPYSAKNNAWIEPHSKLQLLSASQWFVLFYGKAFESFPANEYVLIFLILIWATSHLSIVYSPFLLLLFHAYVCALNSASKLCQYYQPINESRMNVMHSKFRVRHFVHTLTPTTAVK